MAAMAAEKAPAMAVASPQQQQQQQPGVASAAVTGDGASALTREQMLRERYLKGVKKRKCTMCGNTARARCPFRACKTCCTKSKNTCEVHVTKPCKQSPSTTPVMDPRDPRWPGVVSMSAAYGTPFMRAPYTHSPTYQATVPGIGTIRSTMGYVIPQSGPRPHSTQGYGVVPGSRPWQPAPASLEQQELYKLRNLKAAMQAASREAAITNTWRAQKVQEYKDAELAMENEAFDRYMLNMSLLEEVLIPVSAITGLSSEGELLVQDGEATDENRGGNVSDTLMLVDGMRVHQGEIRARKEASRQRMRRMVERHLLTLKRGGQQESFNHEDDELIQVGIPGWQQDFKRFKATTKEGKECLERVELFESLVQKTNLIQTRADIDACGDFYRQNFGHGLDILLPHLSLNVEHLYGAKLRKDENYCSAATLSDLEPEKGNKGQKVSPSKDSHARADTDTSESAKREREEALQKEDERELNELDGQDPEQSKDETKSPAGEEMMDHKRIPNEVTSANEERNIEILTKETGELEEGDKQKQPNWPRLHEGFLKGRGWWKVEADEYSTQIVCQQFLNSSHTVETL